MKCLPVFGALAAVCLAEAQIPEIQVHFDLTGSLRFSADHPNLCQFYDVMGRPSILSLAFYTQQGFRAYAAEKLQPLPGDSSNDPFDEYYFEDEGIWRVGKQYLPFGSGRILHESAIAARGDTNQVLEHVPFSFAVCNSGDGFESGASGRIGSMLGFSFAFGRHFGIAATSLDDIRRPEDAPGQGRGWKEALGVDASHRFDKWTVRAEAVDLQLGETSLDKNLAVFETSASVDFGKGVICTLALSRVEPDRTDFYRVSATVLIVKHLSFEPMIRFSDSGLYDIAAQIRVKF